MQNSVPGNCRGAAAQESCEIQRTIERTVRHLFAFSGHLHSPLWLTECHRPSGRALLSDNRQVTAGWQPSGDGSPFEDRDGERYARDSDDVVIALLLVLINTCVTLFNSILETFWNVLVAYVNNHIIENEYVNFAVEVCPIQNRVYVAIS